MAVEGTVGLAQEGATETTALISKAAAQGELTTEKVGEAIAAGTEEAVIAGPSKGLTGTIIGGSNYLRDGYFAAKNKLSKATKANEGLMSLQEARYILSTRL